MVDISLHRLGQSMAKAAKRFPKLKMPKIRKSKVKEQEGPQQKGGTAPNTPIHEKQKTSHNDMPSSKSFELSSELEKKLDEQLLETFDVDDLPPSYEQSQKEYGDLPPSYEESQAEYKQKNASPSNHARAGISSIQKSAAAQGVYLTPAQARAEFNRMQQKT